MARVRRRRVVYLVTGLLLLLTITLYGNDPPREKAVYPLGAPPHSPFITAFPPPPSNVTGVKVSGDEVKVKTILLWTKYFGSERWSTGLNTFRSCAVGTCRISTDKGEVGDAAALMMNVRDLTSSADLPPHHPPHQVWILHGSEPPYYVYARPGGLNHAFNWTSWYRSDADIFAPYGFYLPLGHPAPAPDDYHSQFLQRTAQGEHSDGITHTYTNVTADAAADVSDHDEAGSDVFGLHDRWVFWMASSCVNYGRRYKLVAALSDLLPVDTYGFCGKLPCGRHDPHCDSTLRRYKFVLAFENGYCRDYLTEKYWGALHRQQVPIVSGGADYSKLAIPGSFIDVDSFRTVQELAAFVRKVGTSRHLYNSFFAWRQRFRTVDYGITNWCQVCAKLHHPSTDTQPQVYSDLRGWMAQDTCPLYQVLQPFWWTKLYVVFKLFGI